MSTSETGARCGCGVLIAEHREVSECAGDPRWPERTADEIERKLLAEGASVSYHPVPSGESPLEERLRWLEERETRRASYLERGARADAQYVAEIAEDALAELARLTAEVARLTAELDHKERDRMFWVKSAERREAEAARYREALYRIACGAMPWTREEMIEHAAAALTTEGGDRAAQT